MTRLNKDFLLKILKEIENPLHESDLLESGMVEHADISDGQVTILLKVDRSLGAQLEDFRQNVENEVRRAFPDAKSVSVILTAEKVPPKEAPDPHGMNKNPPLSLPVKNIIAVASGKGGVGKSTVAAGLAVELAKHGHAVGLLDADIYGPSIPHLMNLQGQKPELNDKKQLIPLISKGVSVMSIGFMVEEDTPMIWRGPMVQSAIYQMLRDVDWTGIDTLIVDLPPGTGDAQLTMAQKVPLTGAVIVSTPQDLALIDARKAIEMFNKTNVPVLGLIENMSTYICENCGHEAHIFDHGHVKTEAEKRGIPFLGEIPLDMKIRDSKEYAADFMQNIVKRSQVFSKT
ncbi:MAG: hypothetical protein CMH28_03325 [Micavibrio sp.]|nr:hypothetical protein [Micavibrio sp.]